MAIKPSLVVFVAGMLTNPLPADAPVIESCATWRSQDDWAIQGPVFTVVQPARHVTIDLGEGMEIRGKPPWLVQLCDGHLTIRRL
jgi:hypothetical protein